MDAHILGALSLALGLGLLIGLQRERVGAEFGGIRTFPLIALLGTLCGWLAGIWGGFVLAAGFLGVAGVALVANLRTLSSEHPTGGQTTEVAALLTFATGALLTTDYRAAGIVVGGLTAVLLHLKTPMHAFAGRLNERDVDAIMRFAIVSLIVLPLLPDAEFGPYRVLNPREIWLIVVLIVGIGLAGYVSYRLFGARGGSVLSGILGGLVSSTATTVAYARRVRESAEATPLAALVIVIASAVAGGRVLVEAAVVAPGVLPEIVPPLAAFFALMVLVSALMLRWARHRDSTMPEQSNPAEFHSALVFGAIYALITLATAAAKDYLGNRALFALAFVSGFVDVDAITLSTARLAASKRLDTSTAWRVILIAALTNLLFKAAVAWALGSKRLLLRMAIPFAAILAGGLVLLFIWPDAASAV
jgi:uncharacterized membrane protein (DUF4010 family)